jgi:hypothetical protein
MSGVLLDGSCQNRDLSSEHDVNDAHLIVFTGTLDGLWIIPDTLQQSNL